MELVKVVNKPGFSKYIEPCLNLGIGFCITQLLLSNCKKSFRKSHLYMNHASHLITISLKSLKYLLQQDLLMASAITQRNLLTADIFMQISKVL